MTLTESPFIVVRDQNEECLVIPFDEETLTYDVLTYNIKSDNPKHDGWLEDHAIIAVGDMVELKKLRVELIKEKSFRLSELKFDKVKNIAARVKLQGQQNV